VLHVPTVQESKYKKKETGKEDKHAKVVVEFGWLSDNTYTGTIVQKNLLMSNQPCTIL